MNEINEDIIFNKFQKFIKNKDNHIPRDYQTIGGMWTVDTWMIDNYTLQLMDEGYTSIISFRENNSLSWSVTNSFKGTTIITYENITKEEFSHLVDKIINTMENPSTNKKIKM